MAIAGDRPTVCMFVRNLFRHDARVKREALTLIDAGYAVVVFAVASTEAEAGEAWQGPIRVVRFTLGTAVSRFFGALLKASRIWYAVAAIPRRIRMVVDRLLPGPGGGTREAYHARYQGRPPPTVQVVAQARTRLRAFAWPMHRFLQTLKFGRLAGRMAAELHPVMYHCHDLNTAVAGYRARRWWPAPLVYDSHELWPHRNRADARRRKSWVLERADRYFARSADAVITVNESIARHIESRYGIPEVIVVRNTPSLTARAAVENVVPLDAVPGPRFMYAGGIQTHRGIEELIQAMALIPEGTLVLAGPGNETYRASLEALALQNGVRDRVRFLGLVSQDALVSTIAQGDIGFCLIKNYCLSYYLSLPNKFFEYLHAGLPIVASDFPEMRLLVDRYDVGVTCDPADPSAIAKAVADLLGRPEDLERMRANARRATGEVNWENERRVLLDLYRRLVPGALQPQT